MSIEEELEPRGRSGLISRESPKSQILRHVFGHVPSQAHRRVRETQGGGGWRWPAVAALLFSL